ncbi:MAG: proteinsorting protein [Bryobacterales bacterium]|nr:proteinsorting protein [Bryobacterales bacterium]
MKCFPLFALAALSVSAQAGLIHSYTFDGTAVTDSAGSADGSLSAAGASVDGGFLTLAGNGWVEFSTHLVPTSGSYSVLLDFRLNGPQNGIAEFISQGHSGGPGFYLGSDGGVHFRLTDSWPYPLGMFPTDTDWHRLGFVVNASSGTSSFYLDGALLDTRGFAIVTTLEGTPTRFGRQFSFYEEYFKGDMDNVLIYDHAIAAGETGFSSAPEPSGMGLALLGVAALVLRRRMPA